MLNKSITKRKHTPNSLTSEFTTNFKQRCKGKILHKEQNQGNTGHNMQAIDEKQSQKISNTYKQRPL